MRLGLGVGAPRGQWQPGLGFSPLSVPGLQLWFRSDVENVELQAGNRVSTWFDRSGNARHAVQAVDANRPIWAANIVNGKPVLVFAGDGDVLTGSFSGGLSLANWSLFAVTALTSVGNRGIFDSSDNGSTNRGAMFFQEASNRLARSHTGGGAGDCTYAFSTSAPRVHIVRRGTSLFELYEGATLRSAPATVGDAASTAMTLFRMGTLFGGGYLWAGYSIELALWNRAITAGEITGLSGYGAGRYAIS